MAFPSVPQGEEGGSLAGSFFRGPFFIRDEKWLRVVASLQKIKAIFRCAKSVSIGVESNVLVMAGRSFVIIDLVMDQLNLSLWCLHILIAFEKALGLSEGRNREARGMELILVSVFLSATSL